MSTVAQILESWPGEPDEDILQLLVDAHAHPTDYKRFSLDKEYRGAAEQLRVSKLCAMSSHLKDQDLVKQLVQEHPTHILPAFGLHPWWSHHISFADPDSDSSTQSIDKKSHYAGLFPGCFDNVELQQSMEEDGGPDLMSALYNSFPEPTLFRDYCANTLQPYLEAFPSAMLGEVGLDRSFRIPVPTTEAKTDREQDRAAKKFTELKIPVPHQLELLRRQMELAFQLNRNISMHSVQAQGQTVELITKLDKTSQRWKTSRSKICLHSYGGSTDTVAMLSRADRERIYFSFSTTINGRLERLGELIRAVPDDRLLIESDYNDIRVSEKRLWEILGVVCHAKGWEREQGAKQLARNWQRFTRQDGEGGEL